MNAKIFTAIAAILVVTVCLASIGPVSDAAEVGNESDLSTQIGEAPDSTETEIKLTADITLNSTLTIPQGKIIVLNLNNSTLTTSADAEVIINNGTLTVKNGYVKANDSGSWSTSKSMHGITNNGTLTVDQDEGYMTKIDGYRAITNYGTTTVNDGTIDTHYRYGIWSDSSNAVLTVNGGIFTASKQGEMARTICTSGTVNIYGGTFTSTGSSGAGDGYVDTIRIYNSGSVLTIDPAPGKTVTVTSETDYAVSDASIDSDGNLHHNLKNKGRRVSVPVDVPHTQKDSIVYRDRLVRETVEVPRDLTAWQKWQMRSFWILLSVLALYVLRKPLLALIRRFV